MSEYPANNGTDASCASREACRRAAADFGQQTRKQYQTGEPWHPPCRGGKTRPSPMSPYAPARKARSPGCRALALPGGEADFFLNFAEGFLGQVVGPLGVFVQNGL